MTAVPGMTFCSRWFDAQVSRLHDVVAVLVDLLGVDAAAEPDHVGEVDVGAVLASAATSGRRRHPSSWSASGSASRCAGCRRRRRSARPAAWRRSRCSAPSRPAPGRGCAGSRNAHFGCLRYRRSATRWAASRGIGAAPAAMKAMKSVSPIGPLVTAVDLVADLHVLPVARRAAARLLGQDVLLDRGQLLLGPRMRQLDRARLAPLLHLAALEAHPGADEGRHQFVVLVRVLLPHVVLDAAAAEIALGRAVEAVEDDPAVILSPSRIGRGRSSWSRRGSRPDRASRPGPTPGRRR